MNFRPRIAAATLLAFSLVFAYAQSGDQPAPKKHAHHAAEPAKPSVEDQIQALRQELQGQIDTLKNQLSEKDQQLQQAQQAAADAQAAAARAQAAAESQQQAVTANSSAVTTLQSTVTDLKANNVSLATTVSDETSAIKKQIANPDTIHYKGVAITPGGFVAGETVYRTKATGGDIPTAFSSLPYESADAYSLSEFYGSARQSRISLLAEGKTSWGTLRGYYEADWLGTGITSNNNQSNSYVLRQRVIWGQAETKSHLAVTGGQLWSLATEDKKGISNLSADIMTPLTIDPNYVAGFVWTRQYGLRVTKSYDKVAFGVAIENPQLLYSASLAGNTPYAVLGSAGQNGGNYNAAISGISSVAPYIQNYVTQPGTAATASVAPVEDIITNTVTANTNVANISFNEAPDVLVKAAFDPGWGHYEVFGIASFAHETVYPGVTTNSVKFGGKDALGNTITDIFTGAAPVAASTTAGSYNNSIVLGGFGGSLRVPVIANKLTVGVKGLYGPGVGRYGDTTLSDVTSDANGNLAPIHNASGLFTLEATPTPQLTIYINYGGDYAARTDFGTGSTVASSLSSPTAYFCPSGYTTANASTVCVKASAATPAELAAGGTYGGHWSTPAVGTTAVGYGSRLLSNSACNTITAAGSNSGSSTGFLPGTSCGAQSRDVQELTGGYWFDFYKGDHGRFRQGIQYGYAVREAWSGASGIGAKGIDNMIWTSLRYYLP